MKALTLHQPWAQFVALGVKTIETRSWSTDYRGRLLIHAGAQRSHHGKFYLFARCALIAGHITKERERAIRYMEIPFGAIVASCELVNVLPVLEGTAELALAEPRPCLVPHGNELTMWTGNGYEGWDVDDQLPYGDFTPGRYAWILEDIKPVEERCPACWGVHGRIGMPGHCWGEDDGRRFRYHSRGDCVLCDCCDEPCVLCGSQGGDAGVCDPIPAKGKQGLWEWTP